MIQSKKKAIFLGDFNDANYHPATKIDQQIIKLLEDQFNITVEEEYTDLSYTTLKHYDLVINYADRWDKRGSLQAVGALAAYAATGGGVLGLHSGIISSLDKYPEVPMLFGARFLEHPPYTALDYAVTDESKTHPAVQGIEPFTMDEEPYFFEMCNFAKRELLMTYTYQNKQYPAAWTVQFGQGNIIYLSQGHDIKTFKNKNMQKLIRQSAGWAAKLS